MILRERTGIHPWRAHDIHELETEHAEWIQQLRELMEKYPNAIVGEVGIDTIAWQQRIPDSQNHEPNNGAVIPETKKYTPIPHQQNVLRYQIQIAIDYDRAVSLHSVGKWKPAEEVLQQFKGSKLRVCIHSYCGSGDNIIRLQRELGRHAKVFVSISQAINNRLNLEKLDDLIHKIAVNRFLTETDLERTDGMTTEYEERLMWPYNQIARVKDLSIEEVKVQVEANWKEFHQRSEAIS